jgi:hypothetical protein
MQSARFLRRLAYATLPLAAVELASPVQAAPTDAELSAARDLFVQAERDEDAENWQAALDKLSRVSQVKLTAGVRYHLALCEEHLGRLATALAAYLSAERQANESNAADVVRLVGMQLSALTPRVPRLALQVAPDLPGAVVRLDGAPFDHARLGAAFPIDPGLHHVEARAPGRAESTLSVTVQEGDVTFLRISLSPVEEAATASPAAEDVSPQRGSARHSPAAAIAFTAAAAGLAGLGAGAYLLSGSAHSDAVSRCAQMTSPCDGDKAPVRAWDWTALAAWGAAAASAAVAVVLWSRQSGDAGLPRAARVVVGPGALGVAGSF